MAEKLYLFARGSPTRGNNDDRRQWRRCGCWVPQPGQWHAVGVTERFNKER